MKVLTVVGNRPQFIKAAAVSHRLRERAEEILVHTGQHYDPELSELFFEELGVPDPEHRLEVGSGSHADQTARTLTGLEPIVRSERPGRVLVYGDTNATLAGALVAAKAAIPLAHVEAGMRSFDRSMPEEVNRVVADHLSELLLCPTPTAVSNLEAEGLGRGAVLVGDVQADVALLVGPAAEERSDAVERLGVERGRFAVATAHRPANVDDPDRLAALVGLLAAVGAELPVVFSVHPRTRARLRASRLEPRLEASGVRLAGPLGYVDLTALLRAARCCLTDSGGLQKEAFLAGTPCVTLRPVTEWVETVEAGWNTLVDLDAEAAVRAVRDEVGREPPDAAVYGGGRAGERTVDALLGLKPS